MTNPGWMSIPMLRRVSLRGSLVVLVMLGAAIAIVLTRRRFALAAAYVTLAVRPPQRTGRPRGTAAPETLPDDSTRPLLLPARQLLPGLDRAPTDGTFSRAAMPTPPPDDRDEKANRKALKKLARRLDGHQRMLDALDHHAVLCIFQAMDAGGKDSTIRAVTGELNPAGFQVFSSKAPSAAELDHDFLWRTTCRLPERGRIRIFRRERDAAVVTWERGKRSRTLLPCACWAPTESRWRRGGNAETGRTGSRPARNGPPRLGGPSGHIGLELPAVTGPRAAGISSRRKSG